MGLARAGSASLRKMSHAQSKPGSAVATNTQRQEGSICKSTMANTGARALPTSGAINC